MEDDWLDAPPTEEGAKRLKKKGMLRYRLFKKRKRKFLNALARTGNITGALKFAGWNRDNMEYWRERDALFAHQYDIALNKAADMLEGEATRRAVDGYDDVVVYQGRVVYHTYPPGHAKEGQLMLDALGDPIPVVVRKYSDRMLELLLKAARPERFRENIEVNNTHKGGVLVVGAIGQPTDPKFQSYEEEVRAHQAKYRVTGEERKALSAPPTVIDVPPSKTKATFSEITR